ncbi:hypothetical protein QUB05_30100 [Microcoleus sp. F10-C6]|uniref:hypothetical protein n=1 Tax=unclassified Microcoleus TaxID=2642155 RepID=UPI002FD463DB
MLPSRSNYFLKNGRVPASLLEMKSIAPSASTVAITGTENNFCAVDIEIAAGTIAQIIPSGTEHLFPIADIPIVDLCNGLVWPCFNERGLSLLATCLIAFLIFDF